MDGNHTIAELNEELLHCSIPQMAQKGAAYFCTCDDLACPMNPANPKNRERGAGCDACIVKNLRLGEIPSCLFNMVGDISDWHDFSVRGFVRFCNEHGIVGTDEQGEQIA